MSVRRLVQQTFLARSSIFNGKPAALSICSKQRYEKGEDGKQGWGWALLGGASLSLAGIKLQTVEEKNKENNSPQVFEDMKADSESSFVNREDKIRHYSPIEKLFDYFSSYQMIDSQGMKTNLMSVRNFFNATTPGSYIKQEYAHGCSSHQVIAEEDVEADWRISHNELPVDGYFLNKLNDKGLLTYLDFHFLFLLISTPKRYLETIFHAFDINANGNVEAKEFIFILTKIANVKADPENILKMRCSGLVKYLFGDDLKGEVSRKDFENMQKEVIDNILRLEYKSYCPNGNELTEVEFCRHLLYSSNFTEKKKERLLKRVAKKYGKGKGISYENFKSFYEILFGGADLERALFLLDTQGQGVNRAEFAKIAEFVGHHDLNEHLVDVIYTLLDENEDDKLNHKEFHPILFHWRHSRGFQKESLAVSVGYLRF